MSAQKNWKALKQKVVLTEEQRRMYAAERGDNFRWVASLLASPSPVTLTTEHIVAPEVKSEITAIGQFAELVYSPLPIDTLLEHLDALSGSGFPLELYSALKGAKLVHSFHGSVAKLPVAIFYRPLSGQAVVSIAGTTQLGHVIQDLRFLKTKHPSGNGSVHSGFWALYTGIEEQIRTSLRSLLQTHDVKEVVVTGHSMGGAVGYLLCIDILSRPDYFAVQPNIKLVAYGSPRVGDAAIVAHFQGLVSSFQAKHGENSFVEYSVRGYNDGVPTLPPLGIGYRHFAKAPLYSTGDQLYNVPTSECEYTLFHTEGGGHLASSFPRGGHNYYNGRDQEKLIRHVTCLEKVNFPEIGWEARYKSAVDNGSL